MLSKSVILTLIINFVIITYVNSASLSAIDEKKYQDLIRGQGLYSPDDGVEIFTARNFKNKLYGQNHALLINFYNSWCGFCQRFVPAWRGIAADVRSWREIVEIGAIDCSEEENSGICREFEILAYPSLRYFHENYQEGPRKIGVEVKKGENVDSLRTALVAQLIKEQTEDRGKEWPKLLPYNQEDLNNVFDDLDEKVKYVFAVVDDKSNISAEVILDLHKVPEIKVISISQDNTAFLQKYNINSAPTLIVIGREDKLVQPLEGNTRESIINSIKNFLKPKGIDIVPEKKKDIFKGRWIETQVPDIAALLEAREREALRQKVKRMGDVVFQMDLETALRYSLKQEIGRQKVIEGEKLDAVKKYLNVIVKYFPLGRKGKNFIEDLITEINSHGPSIKGEDITNFLAPMNHEDEEIFSSPHQWLGCSGSNYKFRGYPCGLWKMFHYLTVSAADHNYNKQNVNPKEVLQAMLAYIKNFFGCQDCSQHFQEMAKKNDLEGVNDLNSTIIWLWLAHNEVNKRLAGDQTEDPEYPKIQFPSVENCPKCKNGKDWNLTEVLHYLRHMYSSINVRYLGADTKVLHDGLNGTRSKRSTSWVIINRMDFSICFMLYVVCFGLLVLIIRQFLKRGYKKKLYVHDLLGKV